MAYVVADRVKETSTTTGTGSFTLAGAVTGFKTFSGAIGVNNETTYVITNATGSEWEVGLGYLTSSTTLTRQVVFSNSAYTNSFINFSAGTKTVFVTMSAAPYNANTNLGNQQNFYPNTQVNTTVIGYAAGGFGDNITTVGANAASGYDGVTAIGAVSNASGPYSIAMGYAATVQSNSSSSIAIGTNTQVDSTSAQWGIAIGPGARVRGTAGIVIGASTEDSTGGNDIRIGFNQDPMSSVGSGSQNIVIGNGSSVTPGNPSNSIAIGNLIDVALSNATYMNQFRIDPTTGLTGPAYTLTYDSTTHEVYAVAAGPSGGFDWVTYQVGAGVTGTIDAPTNYTSSPSGPAYAVIAGSPQYGWSSINPSWSLGYDGGWSWPNSEEYYMSGMNWMMVMSPFTYQTAPMSTDGLVVTYVVYPAGHGAISFQNVWGNYFSWTANYSVTGFNLSSYPYSGIQKKLYGVFIYDNGDISGSISANPSYPSITFEANYSGYVNATLVVFEVTDDTNVGDILSFGATLFGWMGMGNVFGHVWYEYS